MVTKTQIADDTSYRRLGHLNSQIMEILKNEGDNGDLYEADLSPWCAPCDLNKSQHIIAHHKRVTCEVTEPLELVYTDLTGPL